MSDPSESPSPGPSSDTILAGNRTCRPDALNSFQIYTGGWNIMSINYWASAGYTGMVGFVISLLWIITGLGIILVVGFMLVCCREHLKPVPNFTSFGNYTTLGLLIIFTVVSIAGSAALFTGQESFHSDVSSMFTYLMTQIAAAANASVASVPPVAAPQAAQAAEVIEASVNSTSTKIHVDLDDIRLWLLVLSAIMCVLALVGLAFVACHIRPIIYTLVVTGWLLVMGTWILCGVFLLVEAVVGDTCLAMTQWAANPIAGTSFDLIMQCKNANSSNQQNSTQTDPCAQMRTSLVPILTAIVINSCPSMYKDSQHVWKSLFALSAGSMVSICLWILYTRRSTMRLTKVQASGNSLPFQFEEHNNKNDINNRSNDTSTSHSTISNEISVDIRTRSRPRQ